MRFLLIGALLGVVGGSGCAGRAVPTVAPAGISFLALGDSYTIGQGVRPAERWPAQLARLAQAEGLPLQAPVVVARTGWTTHELQTAIAETPSSRPYGLVSLLIGVNNQFRGQTVALYRQEFRALLGTAVGLAGGQRGRVLVLSIPDWGQSPYGQRQDRSPTYIGREIDQFNAVAREECQVAHVAYVDITPLTRAAAGDARQFAPDGLHYSGAQMRQWARQALPTVRALLTVARTIGMSNRNPVTSAVL